MAHAAPGCLARAVHRARTESHSSRKTAIIMPGTAIYSRDPYGDNPHPCQPGFQGIPILPEPVTVVKEMAHLGISGALPWAWTYSQVCRGPKRPEGKKTTPGKPAWPGVSPCPLNLPDACH